jgi:hypothetical protein
MNLPRCFDMGSDSRRWESIFLEFVAKGEWFPERSRRTKAMP